MRTVLLVVADERLRTRLLDALGDASIFVTDSDADALKTLRLIDIDFVIREGASSLGNLAAFLAEARAIVPGALTVIVGPAEGHEEVADFVIPRSFSRQDVEVTLRRAAEKQDLTREVARLRAASPSRTTTPAPTTEPTWNEGALPRVLRQFARVFAAGFDLPRVLEMFLDAVAELLRPARIALLLPDPAGDTYRIVAHRGVAPAIVRSMRLPASRGLCAWLTTQGRPARVEEIPDPEAARDLALVHGVVAVPLLAHGDLTAVLIVGQPVFRSSYGREETETLFDLATHLATAIRDIALHEQLRQEKEFTERILTHMASGVVTIGRDHKIGTFNRKAEEILGLAAADAVDEDLRILPSPLGDMLFDTLSSGRIVRPTEIQLPLGKRWLQVSTYPVKGEEGAPLGAVLVFEDITAHKELEAQKSQADQLQLLTRVVARISDEIKNPLVSINAFTELLDERYDDADFRTRFTDVVRRDVRRLVQVFEKLTGLTSEGELNFTTVDVRSVLDHFATVVEAGDDAAGRGAQITVLPGDRPLVVKVDAPKLRKALAYLVRYLAHNSPAGEAKVSLTMEHFEAADSGESARILVASRTATVPPERLDRLFDPVHTVQESLIDIGPAVSQRLVEAFGGSVRFRQSRHELAFLVMLPLVAA